MLNATSAPSAPSGPQLRLLVSLASWTWPGTSPDGREIAHILITHTPALTSLAPAETVEARMRRLSRSFGGLAGPRKVLPRLGPCLRIVGDQVLLHIPGASRQLRLPTRPSWTELVARNGEAVVLLGLDPLPQSAGDRRHRRLPRQGARSRPTAVRTRPHSLNPAPSRSKAPWMDG